MRGRAVLACAPGEQHELGLLMLACLLRAGRLEIVYLGQATPVVDAVAISRDQNASMLAFSVTMRENIDPLERGFGTLGGLGAAGDRDRRPRGLGRPGEECGRADVGGDLAKAVPTLRRPLQ